MASEREGLKIAERNAFYESLSMAARERFLEALTAAQERGLDEEAAWREAVIAAETTYSPDAPHPPTMDELRDERGPDSFGTRDENL